MTQKTPPQDERTVTADKGDCVSSIAEREGHFWETLWNDPGNAALREERKNPNLLAPGDQVAVPPLRGKTVRIATGKRHVFRRKGVPSFLHLRCLFLGQPRANEPFVLKLGEREIRGTTDGDGLLTVALPPGSHAGELTFGEGESAQTTRVLVGELAPVTTVEGVQARLNNLGFAAGEIDGTLNPETREALSELQRQEGLTVSGEIDEPTRERLLALHGC